MRLDRRADVHDIDGVLERVRNRYPQRSPVYLDSAPRALARADVRVDDRDDAAAGALDCMRVPPPHQTRAHDCSTNGRRGAPARSDGGFGRSAPMCIPDKAFTSSLSSWTRRPVVAE